MKLKPIDALSLKKQLDKGEVILIDVREAHEHAREHIEGSRLAPLSRFQFEDFSAHRDKTAVFYCASGGRTGSNAALLASTGFRDAYHLHGGITAWKAAGLPTRSSRDSGNGPRKRFGWLF
jgi:rhodanese-related sulfurtransferase